ncbi:unnamed protein product [Pieris brassicae]|uniref:Uncharacterized protein n=1 Tax=Pieris brassicae TaxID=7116 RepID=A0A9P0THE8_PIEBR|nr:unnamed protein product [Pieris brassicae]
MNLPAIIREQEEEHLAILHNIAIDMKEDLDVMYDDTENAPEEPRPTQTQEIRLDKLVELLLLKHIFKAVIYIHADR